MRGYNTFANRGRDFEDFVIQVNDLYTRSGKAVVYKVPTEFLPIRDSTGQIKSCKVEHKSCVDFLGRLDDRQSGGHDPGQLQPSPLLRRSVALLAGCKDSMGVPEGNGQAETHTAHRDGLRPDLDAAAHGKRGPGRFSSGLGSSPRRPHRPAVPGNH